MNLETASISCVSRLYRVVDYPLQMGEPEWGKRFRHEIKAVGRSVKMLSADLGVTTGAIYHWLNGHNEITLNQFLLLCAKGRVDPGRVLFGSGYIPQDIKEQITGLAAKVIAANPSASPNYAKMEKTLKQRIKS